MSPASRLLQSAQTTVHSPFEPAQQIPLLDRSKELIPNWITSQAHTSSPNSPAAPIPALVPPVSTGGEDTNPSKLTSSEPDVSTAFPKPQRGDLAIAQAGGSAQAWVKAPLPSSPEGAIQMSDTLINLRHAELTLSKHLSTLDPLSAPFTLALQNLASLRYHIAAAIAQQAALQNPKFTKDLIKATAIVQRDHHRLAREAAAKEREHNRRQREREQDTRYKQRQQDTELKYKRKLELAKLAIEKLDKKAQLSSNPRDNRNNYKPNHSEPNSHNQSTKSTLPPCHSATAPLPSSTLSPSAPVSLSPSA